METGKGEAPAYPHPFTRLPENPDLDQLKAQAKELLKAVLLGANLVIGREDGTDYPISAVPHYTYFAIAPADAEESPQPPLSTLIQYIQQKGCSRTGRAVAKAYDDPALTKQFVAYSEHQRGILCSVEYPVDEPVYLERGQKVFFRFPMGSCY